MFEASGPKQYLSQLLALERKILVNDHINTNVGMAVSKLLGFDLCPRLRNLSERKLYLPRRVAAADGLASVLAYEISVSARSPTHGANMAA
jgi:TnpA family transposase